MTYSGDFLYDTNESLAAVRKFDNAILYVIIQTEDICFAALNAFSYSFRHIRCPTKRVCAYAVHLNPFNIRYVKAQTTEMCVEAVSKYISLFYWVTNKSEKVCRLAVMKNWRMLAEVEQTLELCLMAVKQNPKALDLVNKQYKYKCECWILKHELEVKLKEYFFSVHLKNPFKPIKTLFLSLYLVFFSNRSV